MAMTVASLLAVGGIAGLGASAASAAELPADPAQTTLDWGIRGSFTNYIQSPIAQGKWELSGNVSESAGRIFSFSQGTGTVDEGSAANVSFNGSVHFTGHSYEDVEGGEPILNLKFSNLRVDTAAGYLYADAVGRSFEGTTTVGPWYTLENVQLAKLHNGEWDGNVFTADTTLTADGFEAFGTFYQANEKLDPITLTVVPQEVPVASVDGQVFEDVDGDGTYGDGDVAAADAQVTLRGASGETVADATTNADGAFTIDEVAPGDYTFVVAGYEDEFPVTLAEGENTVTLPLAVAGEEPSTPVDESLPHTSWNIRDSFVSYIGTAGKINLSGNVTQGDAFRWSAAVGTADFAEQTVEFAYTGSVNFTAHGGVLDSTYSDLRVSIDGDEGKLIADVAYNGRVGGSTVADDVVIAELTNVSWPADAADGDQVQITADVAFTLDGAAVIGYGEKDLDTAAPLTIDLIASGVVGGDDEEEPGQEEEEEEEDGDDNAAADSHQLLWGVKESFRNYVEGPIASGDISTSNGALRSGDQFVWNDGVESNSNGTTEVQFTGTVRFQGHGTILDISISDPRVVIEADGSGSIFADVSSKEFIDTVTEGPVREYPNVELVTFTGDWSEAAAPQGVAAIPMLQTIVSLFGQSAKAGQFVASEVVLTEAGVPAFGTFYEAEAEFDTFTLNTVAEDVQEDDGNGNGNGNGNQNGNDNGNGAGTDAPRENGAQQEVCVARVATGTLDWGLKESFRNYISGGIAKGSWSLSGVQETANGFRWSGSGQLNRDAMLGEIAMPGTVHFTGHDGVLDTKISNVRLVIHSSSQASIYADVVSQDMESNRYNLPGVRFANVNIQGASLTADSFSVSGASTTLTSDGATAFAGFYEGGIALDPVSFSLALGEEVDCSDSVNPGGAGGSLARTGLESPAVALTLFAALLMAVGARTFVTTRRSRV